MMNPKHLKMMLEIAGCVGEGMTQNQLMNKCIFICNYFKKEQEDYERSQRVAPTFDFEPPVTLNCRSFFHDKHKLNGRNFSQIIIDDPLIRFGDAVWLDKNGKLRKSQPDTEQSCSEKQENPMTTETVEKKVSKPKAKKAVKKAVKKVAKKPAKKIAKKKVAKKAVKKAVKKVAKKPAKKIAKKKVAKKAAKKK